MGEKMATGRAPGGPRVKKVRRGGWTVRKRNLFLAELGETMNVTLAAAKVGMSCGGAYKLRQRDPAFAEAWRQTVCDAYSQVETLLVERAIMGLSPDAATGDMSKLAKLSERTLMALLSFHQRGVREHREMTARAEAVAAARTGVGRLIADERSARERLMAKLDEMGVRLGVTDHDD